MNTKYIYKKTIRIDGRIKAIIEKSFREVCRKTGLKLSYGKIARAFWLSMAGHPKIRRKCMKLACDEILRDALKRGKSFRNGQRRQV